MSEPLVQPQFRPTLSDLAGARWRTIPIALRVLVVAVAIVVVVVFFYKGVRPTPGRHVVVVPGPHAVNFLFKAPLARVAPLRGELVRLSTPRGSTEPVSFSARPLTLPRYGGDPGGALVLYSVALERFLATEHPGMVLRDEGRTRINMLPAYQVTFQFRENGHTAFGRDIMIVPDANAARIGAVLEMTSVLSPHVPKADALGSVNPLKLSLRSFRLGAQRPS
jgi:hypothetical protein